MHSTIAPKDGAELNINSAIDSLAELFREPYASKTGDLLSGTPEEWRALRHLRILQLLLCFMETEPDQDTDYCRERIKEAAAEWGAIYDHDANDAARNRPRAVAQARGLTTDFVDPRF